ncbi:putative cytochrome P450 [Pleomassaria siparia CBS 279.74]|uniref:Putative cytochrome P450 n=1 Tax=Pleomassaria siparia CBS 279.74 TaxID=1314801 RepID=A0A6G1JV86_9PLEO|nr:putative cytochrome P450 [Pleomassaria siparia CBS 279.74]
MSPQPFASIGLSESAGLAFGFLAVVYVGILLQQGGLRKLGSIVHDFSNGRYYKPWKTIDNFTVLSTKKHIAELSEASVLSQKAVYADMFGFKHTMNGIDHNSSDHRVIRTRLYARLLQVNGPVYLNGLFPLLKESLNKTLQVELRNGRQVNDGLSISVAPTARRLASKLMAVVFYGDVLASDEDFFEALLKYPKDMIKCMAAFQLTPSWMSPYMHAVITSRGEAMHKIQARLRDIMGTGRKTWTEPEKTKTLTIAHNMTQMTDDSDYWDPELLSQSLLGIWFAAAHQPWMFLDFVLLELCARQDWQNAIQEEIDTLAPSNYDQLEKLPLLDSFIKETVRLNPLDKFAIRRKALEPYTFQGGAPSVPKGGTACVSAYDLMHDTRHYPSPNSFQGARFVPKNTAAPQSKFTEISEKFPVWGYGSLACPGRLYASLIIKIIISEILIKYTIRLENDKERTKWYWESFTMPYESTRVVLKERHHA